MLMLVGHDDTSFLLQINITEATIAIVQSIKDFSMIIPSLYVTTAHCILITLQYQFP